jgi:large subunit ribosomal protein L1
MQKISRRHNQNKETLKKLSFNIDEAVNLLKFNANAKFDETAEIHINLNTKNSDQQIRNNIILPNKVSKDIKIAVLTTNDLVLEAKAAGASFVGNTELIEDIIHGKIKFDLLIVTPEIMPQLVKLGKILGSKGIMPSTKSGTITTTLIKTIREFKHGRFEYKADKTGVIHTNFGKTSMSLLSLKENLIALHNSIKLNKSSKVKGQYFKKIHISSTMGPCIQLDLATFK